MKVGGESRRNNAKGKQHAHSTLDHSKIQRLCIISLPQLEVQELVRLERRLLVRGRELGRGALCL